LVLPLPTGTPRDAVGACEWRGSKRGGKELGLFVTFDHQVDADEDLAKVWIEIPAGEDKDAHDA